MSTPNKTFDVIPTIKVPAGEDIIEQNCRTTGIYFLKKGKVNVIKDGVKITEVSKIGSIFGEMAYFLDKFSTATISCDEDSEFLYIENPREFFRDHPDVIYNIAQNLCSRIQSLNEKLSSMENSR